MLAILNGCGAYNPVGTTASTTAPPFLSGSTYVADATGNQIVVLGPSPSSSSTPTQSISGSSTQLNAPQYLSFDGNHQLYVANANSVLRFPSGASGNTAPNLILGGGNTGLNQIAAVAADSLLNIYVSNVTASGVSQVAVFPNAATSASTPSPVLTTNLASPKGMAFDACGNLYVASSGNGQVAVFVPTPNPSAIPSPSPGTTPIPQATGVNGLVCLPGNVPSVAATPIAGAMTQLKNPTDVILDFSGNVYVTDSGANAVFVYPPLGFGNTPPLRIIQGSNTGLSAPTGIALDSVGDILVANGNDTVTVFAPLAGALVNGVSPNPTPIAVFSKGFSSAKDVELTL